MKKASELAEIASEYNLEDWIQYVYLEMEKAALSGSYEYTAVFQNVAAKEFVIKRLEKLGYKFETEDNSYLLTIKWRNP